jgi:lipopolysaccharide transport system permease protein
MTVSSTTETPPPLLTIQAKSQWLPADPRELWAFRAVLTRFASRDIKLRYRQTALGVAWVVLQPLLGAGILSFVFGSVAGLDAPEGVPYFLFSLAGMIAWTAFSQVLTRSSAALVGNAQLVSKVYFPRVLLPLSTVASSLVDLVVSSVVLLGLLLVSGTGVGPAWLLFPLWLCAIGCLSLGVGLILGATMVRYRDVQYILPVAVQFLLYASPVAYSFASVPSSARVAFRLNPLTGLLEGLRWSVLGTARPSWTLVTYSLTVSVLLLAAGSIFFGRFERRFADVI